MNGFRDFWHLVLTLLEFLAFLGMVTWPLFLAVGLTAVMTYDRVRMPRLRAVLASILPALGPVLMLIVGASFAMTDAEMLESLPPGLERLMWAVGAAQLLLSGWLIWWSERGWPLVLAACVWWGWCSVVAFGVAAMSVTGVWP